MLALVIQVNIKTDVITPLVVNIEESHRLAYWEKVVQHSLDERTVSSHCGDPSQVGRGKVIINRIEALKDHEVAMGECRVEAHRYRDRGGDEVGTGREILSGWCIASDVQVDHHGKGSTRSCYWRSQTWGLEATVRSEKTPREAEAFELPVENLKPNNQT
eukprot:Gb_05607 [translate_table: standard]